MLKKHNHSVDWSYYLGRIWDSLLVVSHLYKHHLQFWNVFSSCSEQALKWVMHLVLRIASLLFADDVVLMATSACDLQHSLDWFAAECEAAGMRISTSKSEAMVLSRKPMDCLLQVWNEFLPEVKEFKYLGILFSSEGTKEREMGRRIGAAGAVLLSLCHTVVMKRELSQKAKLSIYRSIFVPTLTYAHEGWVMTERTRSQIRGWPASPLGIGWEAWPSERVLE